ncbi:putative pectinesterase 67 [Dorcoceras hygrometricum]|uniref:Putative pectinesterase 67 n=1 Tax=Dorcoceras hygrometricum TaxID=472368 RepID=A0A2Z7CJ43_9LAMI|nr:putative pectinesterase 67 [Dorcoceras hygrometricum]
MSTGYAIALKLVTGSTVACDWLRIRFIGTLVVVIVAQNLVFTEHYFSDLPSISIVVWSKTGGAELVLLSSFNCYYLGDLIRRVGGSRRNPRVREFLRQLTREFLSSFELLGATGNLTGQSGASASRSPFG